MTFQTAMGLASFLVSFSFLFSLENKKNSYFNRKNVILDSFQLITFLEIACSVVSVLFVSLFVIF